MGERLLLARSLRLSVLEQVSILGLRSQGLYYCPFRLSVLERFHPWAAKSRVSAFSGLRSRYFSFWAHELSTFHRRPTDMYSQAPWCCELGCEVSFRTSPERALAELAR